MSSLDAGLPEPSMVAAVKVMHIFAGIYLWEWASNLEAERDFLLRRRPPRLSLVVYILCRIATLAVICSSLVGFNLHRPFDCEAWFRVVNASVSTALPLCSFLMALRASVIWSRNRLAIITIFSVWLAALGAAIHTSMLGTGSWSPLLHSCTLNDVSEIRWGVLTNFIVELAILSIMLFGLLIKHNRHKLWRILYFQGLAWLLAAVVSKVPPLLMSFLNVDRGWNTMFRIPHVVIMGVTSTRVYRELELSDRIKFVFPTFTSPPRAQNQADDVVQISVIKTVDISFDDSQTPRPPSRAYLPGSGFESGSRVIAEDLASQSQLLTEARTSCLSVDDVTNSKLPR